MYAVYILQSEKDQSFYIGYSSNVEERLRKHNSSRQGYTSRKKPWKVVYQEAFHTKGEAIRREQFLKKQKSVELIKRLIA